MDRLPREHEESFSFSEVKKKKKKKKTFTRNVRELSWRKSEQKSGKSQRECHCTVREGILKAVKSGLASARSLESSQQYSRVEQKSRNSVQCVTSQLLSSLMKTAPQRTYDQKQLVYASLFLLPYRKNISLFRLKKHSHVIREVVALKEVGSDDISSQVGVDMRIYVCVCLFAHLYLFFCCLPPVSSVIVNVYHCFQTRAHKMFLLLLNLRVFECEKIKYWDY